MDGNCVVLFNVVYMPPVSFLCELCERVEAVAFSEVVELDEPSSIWRDVSVRVGALVL